MDDIVKVIYEGRNRRGYAIGPGEAVMFTPGMNEIPKEQWDRLVADKDPGGVSDFLKSRQMHLAEESVQGTNDVGAMNIDGALQVVENAMNQANLETILAQENTRPRGARKGVTQAVEKRQAMFDEFEESKKKAKEEEEAKLAGG